MKQNQSIKRAFAILEVVASASEGIGVTDIAAKTALHKSTVSRMLTTLEEVNAVERVSHWGGYRLGNVGTKIAALEDHYSYVNQMVVAARPYLQELAQATDETINLCLPDGNLARYVDQIDSHYNLQIRDWTGYRIPLHASVDGKVFLAHWPQAHIEQHLTRPLQRFTASTFTDPDQLRPHLAQIREQGYAWTNGEYESGIVAVAAPVWDQRGHVVASICVGGPDFRFPKDGAEHQMIDHLLDVTQRFQQVIAQ
ncbi:MAG: IclR family transcriptional regulator [Chloroflexota bacterium]